LDKARKVFGQAIGKCPRKSIFKAYIAMEMRLVEIDRCRKILEKQLIVFPKDVEAWTSYAEFESGLGEIERCRALYELAIK
jgi:crooked neck